MIQLSGITKRFGDKTVLENVNLTFGNKEIIGLVGENGAGKTTLFNIILQTIQPDSGNVQVQNEVVGYLPQHPEFPESATVESFLNGSIIPGEEYRIDVALHQTGLTDLDKTQSATQLSGGQKTRLYLAKILLSDPELTFLLLDEPTNNLDIEGVEWLENFLVSFDGTVLLTSHDRALLDNVADTIIELEKGKASVFGGNYTFYAEQKEIQKEAYERMYVAQQKKITRLQEDIDEIKTRSKAGEKQFSSRAPGVRRKIRKKAQQAVARQKRLEKFLASEKNLQKPEEKIRGSIQLTEKTHPGKTMLFVQHVVKELGGQRILKDVSLHIGGAERVWLAGLNGSGKSTLFKLITGELKPDGGTIEIGTNVTIGYFSQERQDITPENTILDELQTSLDMTPTEAYKLAIKFAFHEDELKQKISQLSMGQKAKIAFAKLTSGKYTFLLLDEPTNHLEIATREILEAGLRHFEGAILVSSHDRYFLENIEVSRTIVLKDGEITS
jgi:ATPase subunit of ABC transporter with duplicated ATPase domains